MRWAEKVSSIFYPLALVAMVCGFLWQGLSHLHLSIQPTTSPVHLACGGLSLLISCFVCERLFPLRALSELRWVYKLRPKNKLRTFDYFSVIQLVVFGLVFNVIHPALALSAIVLRFAAGVLARPTLAKLLAAGRTRATGFVQDSALVSDVIAAQWITRWHNPPGPLAFRRLLRRSYLLWSATAIVLYTAATSYLLGQYVTIVFALLWTMIGAEVYRCADLRKLRRSIRSELITIGVFSLIGAALTTVIWWKMLLLAAAIAWGSYRRGQPRRITSLTYSDYGIGTSIPPELIRYFFSGLIVPLIASVIAIQPW